MAMFALFADLEKRWRAIHLDDDAIEVDMERFRPWFRVTRADGVQIVFDLRYPLTDPAPGRPVARRDELQLITGALLWWEFHIHGMSYWRLANTPPLQAWYVGRRKSGERLKRHQGLPVFGAERETAIKSETKAARTRRLNQTVVLVKRLVEGVEAIEGRPPRWRGSRSRRKR